MGIIHLNTGITAVARFDTDASIPTKQLKTALQQKSGLDPRRFSRLSLVAALGASLLKQNHHIASDCAVYTAAPFSSPSVFEKMADNVFNHAAMPFDFIANLHNAPAFHAAQVLGSSGITTFIPTDNHPSRQFYPLFAAALSLDAGGQAAVGWCYEYQHEHHCTAEGSVWLLLEHNATQGATMRVRQNRATTNSESVRVDVDSYYWQAVCDELARQPENERVLQAGDWEVLIDAADWEYAQETIGLD